MADCGLEAKLGQTMAKSMKSLTHLKTLNLSCELIVPKGGKVNEIFSTVNFSIPSDVFDAIETAIPQCKIEVGM